MTISNSQVLYVKSPLYSISAINTSWTRYSFVYNDLWNNEDSTIVYNKQFTVKELQELKNILTPELQRLGRQKKDSEKKSDIESVFLRSLEEVKANSEKDVKSEFSDLINLLWNSDKVNDFDFDEDDSEIKEKQLHNEVDSQFTEEELKREIKDMEKIIKENYVEAQKYLTWDFLVKKSSPLKIGPFQARFVDTFYQETIEFSTYGDYTSDDKIYKNIQKLVEKKYSDIFDKCFRSQNRIKVTFNTEADVVKKLLPYVEARDILSSIMKYIDWSSKESLISARNELVKTELKKLDPITWTHIRNRLDRFASDIYDITEEAFIEAYKLKDNLSDEWVQVLLDLYDVTNSVFDILFGCTAKYANSTKRTKTIISNTRYKVDQVVEDLIKSLYSVYQKKYKGEVEWGTLVKLNYIFDCKNQSLKNRIESLVISEINAELQTLFPKNLLYNFNSLFKIVFTDFKTQNVKGFWIGTVKLNWLWLRNKLWDILPLFKDYPESKEYSRWFTRSVSYNDFERYLREYEKFDKDEMKDYVLKLCRGEKDMVNDFNSTVPYLKNVVLKDLIDLEKKLKNGALDNIWKRLQEDLDNWWMKFLKELLLESKILNKNSKGEVSL